MKVASKEKKDKAESVPSTKSVGKKEEAKKDVKNKTSDLVQLQQFVKEVVIEFRKISWPDRKQVIRESYSVIFLVALITLMVLGLDKVLGYVFGLVEKLAHSMH